MKKKILTIGLIGALGLGYAPLVLPIQAEAASTSRTAAKPTKLTVTDGDFSLAEGSTKQLKVATTPAEASTAGLVWKSFNTNVATISKTGVVTANRIGTAKVAVMSADGRIGDFVTVTVEKGDVRVSGISLSTTAAVVEYGKSLQLDEKVTPTNATNKEVTWKSSNEKIAKVSDNGLVTPFGQGVATITVATADGNKTATARITVKGNPVVEEITFSETVGTVMVGKTKKLSAIVSPENAGNKKLTWRSSDMKVATVSATGLVTAKAEGTARIIATSADGKVGSYYELTVEKSDVKVTGVKLSTTSAALNYNKTLQLKETVSPANAGLKTVEWTTSDSRVATVSATGLVKAVGNGQVTITVTTDDGNKVATATITVKGAPNVPVSEIQLSEKNPIMTINETKTLTTVTSPSNATSEKLKWESTNTKVATVSVNGVVTAKGEGRAKIIVTAANGKVGDYASLTVVR